MSTTPQIPERDALLKAVDEIGPTIEAQADESESLRHLSPAGLEAIEAANVLRMMWPRELGGYEADPLTQHEVIERLAYYDASAAWCAFIGAGSAGFVGACVPKEGLDEVQSVLAPTGRTWARIAGSPPPVGRAVPVEGGHLVSGRWGWLSGVHHSDYVYVGAVITEDGEPKMGASGMPEAQVFMMPTSEVEIEDSWHTAGLSGTGSAHVNGDSIFVPTRRSFDFPFATPLRGGALFRLPVLGFFGPAFSGFPQGIARRALDEIKDRAGSKMRIMAGKPLAERGVFQRDLAKAHDDVRAIRLLVREELTRLWQQLHDGVSANAVEAAELLSAFSRNADCAIEATEVAYRYAGGDAVFLSDPLQRSLRDMRVAAQHILIGEYNYEALGRALVAESGDP